MFLPDTLIQYTPETSGKYGCTWWSITCTSPLSVRWAASKPQIITYSCIPSQKWCWMAGTRPQDVSYLLWSYWTHCDMHTVEDVIILYRSAIVLPILKRENVIHTRHEGHQGIMKCQLWSQNCVYWSGMMTSIQWPIVKTRAPWQNLSTTLFNFNGCKSLVVSASFSKMSIVN